MRTVVAFLLMIDMMVMQRLGMEVREASLEKSSRKGMMAWGVTVIVGIILILILSTKPC